MNYYYAYNFVFKSELEIPELEVCENKDYDVEIRFDSINYDFDKFKKNRIWKTKDNYFVLKVKNIGIFLVKDANTIIIDCFENTKEEDLRFVLLGSVFAALLQQKKLLTLHAGCVKVDNNNCILFIGPSGYGKSTLTTAFSNLDYEILSDDVVALDIKEKQISIPPSFPKLRLWKDSAKQLKLNYESFSTSRVGLKKYMIPIPRFCKTKLNLKKIYLLNVYNKDEIILEELNGAQKIKALIDNTYRIKFLSGMKLIKNHNTQILKVCSQIDIVKITRPLNVFLIDELIEKIQKDLLK